jgi:hypothetical protein
MIKRTSRTFLVLIPAFLLFLALPTVLAQDLTISRDYRGSADFAVTLAFVAEGDPARAAISFADYRAAERARGLPRFTDFSQYFGDWSQLWIASLPSGGIPLQNFGVFDEMPTALGIDFHTIDQSLLWGMPPEQAMLVRGTFNAASMSAAHAARGFVETAIPDGIQWCPPDGCDQGMVINIANRLPADIFGGDLGRRFPRALIGDVIVSSASEPIFNAAIRAGTTGERSLAANPNGIAALVALDGQHHLRAAQLMRPEDFLELGVIPAAGMSEADIRQQQDALRGGAEDLPVYQMAVFGDLSDENGETALVALIYTREADAQIAAERLAARLQNAQSYREGRFWSDMIAERGGRIDPPEVIAVPQADRWVVLLALVKALPANTPDPATGRIPQSGELYRLLINSYYSRDLGWLQPVLLR